MMLYYRDGQYYILSGAKRLRSGLTTGTTSALAAKAATIAQFSPNIVVESVSLITPQGLRVSAPVAWVKRYSPTKVAACILKDSGDDKDITCGASIIATLDFNPANEGLKVTVDGGEGIGRVTKPGLKVPPGKASINPVPEAMIKGAVEEICHAYLWQGTVSICISIPEGETLALHTLNPKLGIEGGLSILGTTGLVIPQSEEALLDSIELELNTIASTISPKERSTLVITIGEYKEKLYTTYPYLKGLPIVQCSNYIGHALDLAVAKGWTNIVIAGGIGKLVKLAGGVMNTHSGVADCRLEIVTACASVCGAPIKILRDIMAGDTYTTVLQAIEHLKTPTAPDSLYHDTIALILSRATHYASLRVKGAAKVKVLFYPPLE